MTRTLAPPIFTEPARSAPSVRLRPIEAADCEPTARILFDAFAGIADRHGFPRDFPSLEGARQFVTAFAAHPDIWGVVAELEGRIIGSNFLDERSPIRGLGPITVDPKAQAGGVGRLLMQAAIARGATGVSVRLLQDSFNSASLALYASLGFEAVAQVVLVTGVVSVAQDPSVQVRPLDSEDLDACEQLCVAVHGYDRTTELRDALHAPGVTPMGAHRDGRLVAYATTLSDFGLAYAVGESERALFELVCGAVTRDGPPASFLLPLHQHELVRSCLGAGLRFVKPMTYMVTGNYQRPRGAWIPSVLA